MSRELGGQLFRIAHHGGKSEACTFGTSPFKYIKNKRYEEISNDDRGNVVLQFVVRAAVATNRELFC